MMKILVFSDSHGMVKPMRAIAKKESPDFILHLGDYESDCDDAFPDFRVVKVRGNCDDNSTEETERFLDFGKGKIWMTHGHLYRVKSGLDNLLKKGIDMGASVILYGHTHHRHLLETAHYTVLNPGTPDQSYGVIEMENGEISSVSLREIDD